MDLSELKLTDWMIGGGTVAYLLAMFLPWYDFGIIESTGWSFAVAGWLPLLLIAFVFVALVLPKLVDAIDIPDPLGPLSLAQAAVIASGGAAVLVLLRLLIRSDNVLGVDTDFQGSRSFGLLLALLAAVAVAGGAFLRLQGKEEIGPGGGGPQPPTTF